MEVNGELHGLVAFPWAMSPGTHYVGDCVGLTAGLYVVEKR
jgi:hypothetical protein